MSQDHTVLYKGPCRLEYFKGACQVEARAFSSMSTNWTIVIYTHELEPIAKVTIAIGGFGRRAKTIFIKDWSENEGMVDFLLAADIISGEVLQEIPCDFAKIKSFRLSNRVIAILEAAGFAV